MPYFLTEYGRFGSEIKARSAREAWRFAKKRGLGEKPLGEMVGNRKPTLLNSRPSQVFASTSYSAVQKLHALCWLGYLALSSKSATVRDVFDDDDGFLHQAAHYLQGDVWFQGGRRAYKRRVLSLIRRVELRVPGLQ